MTQSTPASTVDRLAVGYQLKIHLLDISPQISRRVLVRGDATLAELTLAESKALLQIIRQKMIGQQVATHLQAHPPVGLRKKGRYPLQLKTLFSNVTVDSPRY